MQNKKFLWQIFLVLIIGAVALAAVLGIKKYQGRVNSTPDPVNSYVPNKPDVTQADHALINVPFTAQAPTGNWSDPRQEDGCEEASLYMSWLWINNQSTNPQVAEKAITDMSDFEQSTYGNYHDFNAEDTAKLMADYYHYNKLEVRINPTVDDMKNALREDKIVLIPTNGQLLHNPHYKQPGPTTHMLVVKGFDDSKGQFITNDPGTRYGEGYTYAYNIVYNAMVDYPSGNHGSQVGRPKAMIIISK